MSTPAESLNGGHAHQSVADVSSIPQPQQAPPGRRGWIGILQILGVIAIVSMAILYAREPAPGTASAGEVPATGEPSGATAPSVRVIVPVPTTSTLSVNTTGSVQVRSYVAITPQVGGAVVGVAPSLRAGGEFAAGDVLFEIDPRDYQLALDQANAEVAAAEKRLMLVEAEGDDARGNYALLHGDAPVPVLVAKVPQIELSRAELDAARARAARAELDLQRSRYSLPFAGRVTQTSVGVGQTLLPGQAVGQVFALEALEVSVPISQAELAGLDPAVGRAARVSTAGQTFEAVVDRIGAELDPRSRFATVFLALADDVTIPPGTFVDVKLLGDDVAGSLLLPESVEQAGGRVWVVRSGVLEAQMPQILARTPDGLITAGFDAGEGVVLGSVPGAHAGMAVTGVTAGAATTLSQ